MALTGSIQVNRPLTGAACKEAGSVFRRPSSPQLSDVVLFLPPNVPTPARYRWPSVESRMEGLSIPEPMSGCWLWTGKTINRGYGTIAVFGTQWLAHRVGWVLRNGPIPTGLNVCHVCDVRPCVNPDHLFLGTQRDNARDMCRKGRQSFQVNPALLLRGEACGFNKLNESEVRQIRHLRSAGASCRVLSETFGVTLESIYQIARRITWKHVA